MDIVSLLSSKLIMSVDNEQTNNSGDMLDHGLLKDHDINFPSGGVKVKSSKQVGSKTEIWTTTLSTSALEDITLSENASKTYW